VTEVLFRLPLMGRFFRFMIPVANYVDAVDWSMRERYQWAVLDTFDMLAPAHDFSQREADVVGLLKQCGVGGIRRLPNAGLNRVRMRPGFQPVKSP